MPKFRHTQICACARSCTHKFRARTRTCTSKFVHAQDCTHVDSDKREHPNIGTCKFKHSRAQQNTCSAYSPLAPHLGVYSVCACKIQERRTCKQSFAQNAYGVRA
ncbi:hypothetical protein AMTRI_Chr13g86540 [Amborella trichopoda]